MRGEVPALVSPYVEANARGFNLLSLHDQRVETLEALADTVIPGCKRGDWDMAIAGVSDTPGAVEAGALTVLRDPATGIEDGVDEMADLLNEAAREWLAARNAPHDSHRAFVGMPYAQRRECLTSLLQPSNPMRDHWFILALFCYMAYDSAPHLDTAQALRESHPGLMQIGFFAPESDGEWRFEPASYGRPLARLHPDTDETGNLP